MTTIIVDERTKKGKMILDLVRELKAGEIVAKDKKHIASFNRQTLEAIQEATEGKTVICESYEEYLKKVGE